MTEDDVTGHIERRINNQPEFEERVADVLQHRHRWRWRLLSLWIIIFSVVAIILWRQNANRIDEIKATQQHLEVIERREHNIELCQTVKMRLHLKINCRRVMKGVGG